MICNLFVTALICIHYEFKYESKKKLQQSNQNIFKYASYNIYYNNILMDKMGRDILIKLIQCILQSRINVEKKQIRHFDQVNKQLHKNTGNAYQTHLPLFLNSLLLSQKYNLRTRIDTDKSYEAVSISFKLVHKATGIVTQAQVWSIEFEQYRQIQEENNQQQFQIITTLFQELILFLNRQPLFSEYQRNPSIKKSFILDYELRILNQKKKQKLDYKTYNISQIHYKHTKQRICPSFIIKIECYYLPKFDGLFENMEGHHFGITDSHNTKQKSTIDTSKNNKLQDSDNQKSRKTSIYQFYDKQLDFVFLASDDETFKNSPKNQIKEVDIANYMEDQFELLVVSKDEEFLDDNKNLFNEFSGSQINYLKN